MPLRAPALGPAPRQGEPPCRQVRHPSPCLVTGGGKRQGWRERRAGTWRAQNGHASAERQQQLSALGSSAKEGFRGQSSTFLRRGTTPSPTQPRSRWLQKGIASCSQTFQERVALLAEGTRAPRAALGTRPPPLGRETYLAARRAPVAAPAWRAAAARRPRPPAARGRCPRFRRTATASRGAPSRVPLPAATPTTPQGGSAGETPATRARALDVHHHHAGLLQSARAET